MKHILHMFGFSKPSIVIVAGPTASGKTSCALDIAEQLSLTGTQCEIISADSRQIYRGLECFSGAITASEMRDIPHHLVSCIQPTNTKNAAWFKTESSQLIQQIHARGRIPIIVGGTGFWIQSLLFTDDYPAVAPNDILRAELNTLSHSQLRDRLEQLDPASNRRIDTDNPRRLIRAIEIATTLGTVPEMRFTPQKKYNFEMIYFNYPLPLIQQNIVRNVSARYRAGLLSEAQQMRDRLSPERCTELGLAYKYIHQYWNAQISERELVQKTIQEEYRYARRQKIFFKKMIQRSRVNLHHITDPNTCEQVIQQVIARIV